MVLKHFFLSKAIKTISNFFCPMCYRAIIEGHESNKKAQNIASVLALFFKHNSHTLNNPKASMHSISQI